MEKWRRKPKIRSGERRSFKCFAILPSQYDYAKPKNKARKEIQSKEGENLQVTKEIEKSRKSQVDHEHPPGSEEYFQKPHPHSSGESSVGSTWPPHGSNLNVSADGFLDTCASSPITGFHLNSGIIPVILYFNEAVEVVSSSTITVQSVHYTNKDLIWSSLSTNNSRSSQAWVTRLTFHKENLHSLQTHPVKVSLGHS
ncbi:hypothetical protein HYC85_024001 [Camellia sinensis]|uniref:Uncharacterized protein n=1 Tax=Camellia sinensis TaxID=4442 RepID=A0A7J7GG46_CAMSI|nr:hypothetical protein HYC85_024001 [Camellia sinensis]